MGGGSCSCAFFASRLFHNFLKALTVIDLIFLQAWICSFSNGLLSCQPCPSSRSVSEQTIHGLCCGFVAGVYPSFSRLPCLKESRSCGVRRLAGGSGHQGVALPFDVAVSARRNHAASQTVCCPQAHKAFSCNPRTFVGTVVVLHVSIKILPILHTTRDGA